MAYSRLPGIKEDPPRNVKMVEMQVMCRPLGQCLPDGNLVKRGENIIQVYEDHVAEVEALIETELDKVDEAKQHYERQLEAYTKDADVDREKAEKEYGGSLEASFHQLYGRDIKPLFKATVTKTNLPPPQDERLHRENATLVKELMTELGPVLGESAAAAATAAVKEVLKNRKG
jgi:hypothetical protein